MKILRFYLALSIILVVELACIGRKSQPGSYADSAGRINDAITVLEDMVSVPEKSIPLEILRNAAGIVVIPSVVKASAFFGGGKGEGLMSIRNKDKSWSYPSFITTEARSIGWQLGIEEIDMVLIIKSKHSIEKLLENGLTLGISASAAAGPLGRFSSAGKSTELNSDIYSYARARGLFLGASFDGSIFRIDNNSNAAYYGAKYISAKDIFQDKVSPKTNLDLTKKFIAKLDSISHMTSEDSSGT
jgi:lipid-binding SYLF domain-containing protein